MNSSKRIYALDVIKFIASICIIFHHYQGQLNVQFPSFNFYGGSFYFGNLVELFFIISGFLMYSNIQKIGVSENFSCFFGKRFVRFFPINAITAAAHTFLIYLGFNGFHIWGWIISSFGLFSVDHSFTTYNVNSPCWYVSVLLICYIWFYFLTYWSKRNQVPPQWSYAVMILVGLLIQQLGYSMPFFNSYTGRGYFAFFTGLLLRQLIEQYGSSSKLQLAALAILAGFLWIYNTNPFLVSEGFIFLLTLFVYPSFIFICVSPLSQKIFRFPWLSILGEVSFGMYLWHTPFIQFMLYLNAKYALELPFASREFMILVTAGIILFSFISLYLIEKPITKALLSKFKNAQVKTCE